jgi:uncharacterized RDD family membrane protein YckC
MNSDLETYERRFLAYFIDLFIMYLLSGSILGFLNINQNLDLFIIIRAFGYVPFIFYGLMVTLLSFITNGYTIGSFIMRTRIIRNDNKHLSLYQCVVRSFLLAIYTVPLINVFYMLIRKTTVSLFDYLTNTRVKSPKRYLD